MKNIIKNWWRDFLCLDSKEEQNLHKAYKRLNALKDSSNILEQHEARVKLVEAQLAYAKQDERRLTAHCKASNWLKK